MFANSKKVTTFAPAIEREILDKKDGPFVYRLGRKIFILERGVRFPYGLPTKRREISSWLISLLFYYTRPFFAIFTSPTSLSR